MDDEQDEQDRAISMAGAYLIESTPSNRKPYAQVTTHTHQGKAKEKEKQENGTRSNGSGSVSHQLNRVVFFSSEVVGPSFSDWGWPSCPCRTPDQSGGLFDFCHDSKFPSRIPRLATTKTQTKLARRVRTMAMLHERACARHGAVQSV